jgi:predicted dehydrogenase
MIGRRDVLKAGAAAALAGSQAIGAGAPLRIGFVGVGARGTALMELLLKIGGVQVPAIADIDENNLRRAQTLVEKQGQPKPEGYSRGTTDFKRLCERNDVDIVLIATPWQWHTAVAVAAMKAGKHAATEVPAAVTVEECWELVETAEKTGKQCAMLENECYSRNSLLVFNILRKGLLGEPMFAEAGYMHDLRAVQFGSTPWLLEQSRKRNGNLYPTHPMGPIAWWMDITRGDNLTFLVSMSSKSGAMQEFASKKFGSSDPRAKAAVAQGDVNTTLLRTEQGRSISLYFDTSTPRPKEQLVRLQGSKGAYSGMVDKIFLDGRSNVNEGPNWLHNPRWEEMGSYRESFDHRLWKTHGEKAKATAHGGTDFMVAWRFLKNFREGKAPDIDVYDAATWSAIAPLTERSVAERSRPVDIPDFTRGKWQQRVPIDPDGLV